MVRSRVGDNMAIEQPSESIEETVHRLKEEIDRLNQQQSQALKTATYLGMTPDEAQEYDQRRTRITELVMQLSIIIRT